MYRNRKWLYNKYINEKLSSNKIAKICNVNTQTICDWLRKYNIPIRSRSEANHLASDNHCDLSREAIEWINGELLGDGCLRSRYEYSAMFSYSSKHLEYIEYVRDTLKSFGIEQAGKIYKQYYSFDCYGYDYRSCTYPELSTIYKQWYPKGKKIIPKNLKLTPLTLRQHYIGDGSLEHHKLGRPSIRLCTYGFTVVDVEYFIIKLINLGIRAKRNARNAINISVHSVKDFLNYIDKCPVECYQYKWNI